MSKAIHPASRVSSAVAPNSARPTSSEYEASSSGAASMRRHSGTIDERQSPPPYLESQRRASSAASRSFATSLWPTRAGALPAGGSSAAATGTAPAAGPPPRGTRRSTDGSAGVISHREAGTAYALTAKDPARDCQMPPPPARRPARSNRYSSVADRTASPTSRGNASPTSGVGSASARPISCSGTGRPSFCPIAAAMRWGAAPCGIMPFDTQRATEVLS